MYRNARIHVADVLDEVVVQATVFTADWRSETPAEVETFSVTINSVGSSTSSIWLRDALIGLAETL